MFRQGSTLTLLGTTLGSPFVTKVLRKSGNIENNNFGNLEIVRYKNYLEILRYENYFCENIIFGNFKV